MKRSIINRAFSDAQACFRRYCWALPKKSLHACGWAAHEFATAEPGDKRLLKRLERIATGFAEHPGAAIPQARGDAQSAQKRLPDRRAPARERRAAEARADGGPGRGLASCGAACNSCAPSPQRGHVLGPKNVGNTQDATPLEWSERMAESEMTRLDGRIFHGGAPRARWDYTTSLFGLSLHHLGQQIGDEKMVEYGMKTALSFLERGRFLAQAALPMADVA
ncbi:MAG: IS4/Tn5 family transposase DNA-binding protein, partial [Opitutaceae bacterium]